MSISRRTLGRPGLAVPMQGLGCMGMSQSYGTADPAESVATIHRALELGVTFLDTANVYGDGHNEELVGRGDRGPSRRGGARHQVLADPRRVGRHDRSTAGPDYVRSVHRRQPAAARHRPRRPLLPAPGRPEGPDRGHRRRDGRAGRRRQGPPPGTVRGELAPRSSEQSAVHPIAALQSEWSLWTRDLEDDVLGTARRLGIGIVPFSPLGPRVPHRGDHQPGRLRRRTTSASNNPRFQGENFAPNLRPCRRGARDGHREGMHRRPARPRLGAGPG